MSDLKVRSQTRPQRFRSYTKASCIPPRGTASETRSGGERAGRVLVYGLLLKSYRSVPSHGPKAVGYTAIGRPNSGIARQFRSLSAARDPTFQAGADMDPRNSE